MKHLKVRWIHSSPEYPEWIYSELDEQRWEIRKVEIFLDGSLSRADKQTEEQSRTGLGEIPVPGLQDIAASKEFSPEYISNEEFELVWMKANITK